MSTLPRRLAFSLIPLVVIFTVAEVGLRIAGWPPDPTAAFEHNEPFWVTDPGLRDFPMLHKERGTTFPVSTNADGLRGPLVEREAAEGSWRVMAMGCSTTFGWGVADTETYPARLGQKLKEQGHSQVEVINGGQPGYTSFQGRWLWDRALRYYHPDVVLLGFVVQDARKAAYTDLSQAILQGDARFLKNNLLYRLRSYLMLRSLLGHVQIQAKERGQGDEGGAFRVPPEHYIDNLKVLIHEIQAIGGTPVLFGYPLERAGYTARHRAVLQAIAEHEGIPHFDPQAQMEVASGNKTYYFPRDRGHANAAGNDLIATWVMAFLEEEGLLGEGGT